MLEFKRKLHVLSDKRQLLLESISTKNEIGKRMSELRETLENEDTPIVWIPRDSSLLTVPGPVCQKSVSGL